MNDPFGGFEIRVSSMLAYGKKAVCQGNTLWVSPAMYALIRAEEGEALRRLLESIEVVNLPKTPLFYDLLPMTVTPP